MSFFAPEEITAVLAKVGQVLAVFIIGWIAISILLGVLNKALGKRVPDAILRAFLISVIGIAIRTLLFVSCLDMLGVSVTSIITAIGAVGLALGLAMQDSLGNLAQGVVILFARPFQVGDYVEIDGMGGTVEDMDLLRITLSTPDRKRVYISNGQAAKAKIINYTAFPERRLEIVAEVSATEDLDKVCALLKEVMTANSKALSEPSPAVYLSNIDNDNAQIIGRVWVISKLYWELYYELLEEVRQAFDKAEVTCPAGKPRLRMEVNQLPM